MDAPDGYFFPRSSSRGSTAVAAQQQLQQQPPRPAYQNEQPAAAAPHHYYGAPPPDMQQCYPPQQAGPAPGFMPFPNDPYFTWHQQQQAYMAQQQMQQQQQVQHHHQAPPPLTPSPASLGYLPPPPQPPPPSLLLGQQERLPPPPKPPNLNALLGCLEAEEGQDVKPPPADTDLRRPTSRGDQDWRPLRKQKKTAGEEAKSKEAAAAPAAPPPPAAAAAAPSQSYAAVASAAERATPSLSSTSTASIPSLLDGLRADVARNELRASRTAPDLRSIEHAASILSSRTGKSPRASRRADGDRPSRRAEERSDSRKENRGAESTRGGDRRREERSEVDDKRREERRRSRERRREDTDRGDKRRDGDGWVEKDRERERGVRSSQSTTRARDRGSSRRERRRVNEDKRREEEQREKGREKGAEKEKPAKNTVAALKPADIQLNWRECTKEKGEVQVYLNSEDEREGSDEYEDEPEEHGEEGEGEERGGEEAVAESDMDIETEAEFSDEPEGGASNLQQLQQPQHGRSLSTATDWGSGCAPEDEEEHCMTPEVFFASGPSRRVNNPLYRESHRRARALASQALSEDYRERYDLISKMLRSRCIFRGLASSCGPDAPKLTINDPRPKSKHVQTFPSKESNVQYHGPDAFTVPPSGAPATTTYKKTAGGHSGSAYPVYGAPPGTLTFVSRSKLVRAPVAAGATASASNASTTASAPAAATTTSLKRTIQNPATTPVTASPSASSTTSSAASSEGPTPAKLSRVDELMGTLISAPSSPTAMRKARSEPRLEGMGGSDEARPLAPASSLLAVVHSPRADRNASAASPGASRVGVAVATAALPHRSALSFRKIGDHVVRPGSKLCFEWAESGACKAGVFCHFEHGEGAERVEKSVCSRMLRGLCRGGEASGCPLPHGLLPHQMPICEHYLRCACNHGPEACGLVHIKHNEKVPVCVFFNQGKCTKEDDCTFRHQYRSDVVRSLGVHAAAAPLGTRHDQQQQRGQRSRLPKGRALLTAAAAAAAAPSMTSLSSAAAAAAPAASDALAVEDTSTFDWIM